MAITRRTDYAVRLMYELGLLPPGATLSRRDLAECSDVPESFATSIVAFLVEAGLVVAEGYRGHLLSLAVPPSQISMAQIVRACEPDLSLAQCVRNPDACARMRACGVHVMWTRLDAALWDSLGALTLAEVASGSFTLPEVSPAAHPCTA